MIAFVSSRICISRARLRPRRASASASCSPRPTTGGRSAIRGLVGRPSYRRGEGGGVSAIRVWGGAAPRGDRSIRGRHGSSAGGVVVELHGVAADRAVRSVGDHEHVSGVQAPCEVLARDRAVPHGTPGPPLQEAGEFGIGLSRVPRILALAVEVEPPFRQALEHGGNEWDVEALAHRPGVYHRRRARNGRRMRREQRCRRAVAHQDTWRGAKSPARLSDAQMIASASAAMRS